MAIKVNAMKRVFQYSGIKLPCPNSAMSVDAVKDLYAATYPELNNCEIEGPETVGDELVYKFKRAVGTKG